MAENVLTVITLNGAYQAEELDHPAEILLQVLHKHTRQDLKVNTHAHVTYMYIFYGGTGSMYDGKSQDL